MAKQDCSPVGQKAKGKIPNNPLLKGSTRPSSSAQGEISNTRTFWGGQVKTIASSSQLSSDIWAPDCPSRTCYSAKQHIPAPPLPTPSSTLLPSESQVKVWDFQKACAAHLLMDGRPALRIAPLEPTLWLCPHRTHLWTPVINFTAT